METEEERAAREEKSRLKREEKARRRALRVCNRPSFIFPSILTRGSLDYSESGVGFCGICIDVFFQGMKDTNNGGSKSVEL